MNNFFLLNEAIDLEDFIEFKSGMSELVAIGREKGDIFRKHESVYNVYSYGQLFTNFGQVEQNISMFFEQLTPCATYINNETIAENTYENENNAFLGIDFQHQNISSPKQIINDSAYKTYKLGLLSLLDKLKHDLGTCSVSSRFEKDFLSLDDNVKYSIIEEFKKAKNRGLKTSYYPDTKIIKDVSPDNYQCKVYELRVYRPVALRVYFNESPKRICLGTIEQKSNPNQNQDINSAHTVLNAL